MKTNLRVRMFLCVFVCASSEFLKVSGGLTITTTKGPEMSWRNVSGGSVRIYRGPAKKREGEIV